METIAVQVNKKGVYEEVAKATDYTGSKLLVTMFAKANTLRQVGCRSSEASRLRPHGKPPRCFS